MGLLYATKLSTAADVVLIGNNKANIDQINQNGITVKRGDSSTHYNVPAHLNGTYTEAVDLVIMFTKAYITRQALADNKAIIGQNTVVMTLQNGAGHESVLQEFAPADRILIGTTAQGSYRENAHTIVNSGLGDTNIGAISNDFKGIDSFVEVFNNAGFPCFASDKIHQMVWICGYKRQRMGDMQEAHSRDMRNSQRRWMQLQQRRADRAHKQAPAQCS